MPRITVLLLAALHGAAVPVAAATHAPFDVRLVHDGEALRLTMPAAAPKAQHPALEASGWEALAPVMRVLRKKPPSQTVLDELRDRTRASGALVSNSSKTWDGAEGQAALRMTLMSFRRPQRTSNQVAVWSRLEAEPAADVLRVRFALHSYELDDDAENVELDLEYWSAPMPGADPLARGTAWAADDGKAIDALLGEAVGALRALYLEARAERLPAEGPRSGTLARIKKPLRLAREDGARLLLRRDDTFYSVPRESWQEAR